MCELTNDVTLENDMRQLTVRPEASYGQELLLMDSSHSMLDAESAEQLRALVAKGVLSPGVVATTDCRAEHRLLSERGVVFIKPPPCVLTASRPSCGTTRATGTPSPNGALTRATGAAVWG